MGSLGEEELVQMVRDFIESESPSPFSLPSSPSNSVNHDNSTTLTLQEILWRVTGDEVEVLDKILMYVSSVGNAGDAATNLQKWVVMRLKMDGFEASLCKTSRRTATGGFQFAGGYEYIEVMLKAAINGVKATRLIVDMDFRSQFELARPTPTYTDLINTLPSIFVGNEEKLNKIISLLCAAAKQSLKERGLHIPPWRKANHMQSKWLSENCKKVPIFPAPKSNTEVGGMDKWESKAPQCSSKFSKWVPPVVKPRTRGMDGGGSALSSQFSNMGINCC
ncbi:hypothetical protein VitviT2T_027991 [Vitis vinifera]|uniref:Uncharacterized protein n=2 Tax=Vitis vinifera TaxID=29760 RepID=A0ABY9DRU9_VITVI|nr:uncharacterized protein LOC104882622 [Vitis vinifera]RVW85040.1 hypothetical protein CK203_037646 [Vitis vinifera]WKA10420.1 hypothetical protein VitviT2T_027991 [Vitis vinifera]|eukprot:XP_010664963.1 PREDICTED: uncharacterized protein LOC104882622 [Vitis vinifera]